jgi:hypothetical protein
MLNAVDVETVYRINVVCVPYAEPTKKWPNGQLMRLTWTPECLKAADSCLDGFLRDGRVRCAKRPQRLLGYAAC